MRRAGLPCVLRLSGITITHHKSRHGKNDADRIEVTRI